MRRMIVLEVEEVDKQFKKKDDEDLMVDLWKEEERGRGLGRRGRGG